MKKLLILILTICFTFAIIGCGSKEKYKNESDLYPKAVAILDEFKDDQRIIDFRKAYDLLMTLPSDEDDFAEQLEKVNSIYKKYGQKLKYGEDLLWDYKKTKSGINKKHIKKYRNETVFYEANILFNATVYPALFEKYGNEAENINGLTSYKLRTSIMATGKYKKDETKRDSPDFNREIWKTVNRPVSTYSFNYYNNNIVWHIKLPIVRSNIPLQSSELETFFKETPNARKRILNSRFPHMLNKINLFSPELEILHSLFNEKELTILNNFIRSIGIENIWERDYLSKIHDKPLHYLAMLLVDYKNYHLTIDYGVDSITLSISSKNKVNEFSNRWSILHCGLIFPYSQKVIESYNDEISNNKSANNKINDGVFDLDTNSDKYTNHIVQTNTQVQNNKTSNLQSNFIIETAHYTLKTPASWSNDCTYKIHEADNHAYNLTFYEKLSHQKNGDGQLFSIMLYPGFEDYTMLPEYNYLGKLKIKGLGNFNVIITYPTDITFSEEYVEKYNDLKEAIPYVLKNITFKEGYTFSNQPNK